MDPIWLICAFALGFAAKRIGLPPLVGFLTAGFVLHLMGVEKSELLNQVANLGVLLLLFTIGLKLKIKSLLKPQIWAVSSLHVMITIVLFSLVLYLGSIAGLSHFTDFSLHQVLLVSFALSFSSTIFAVKILEETGTSRSTHGKIAIGILIMQDLFAVLFLTLTAEETPSVWALALLLLLFLPWLLRRTKLNQLLEDAGHGELFLLLGILIPLGAAQLFYSMGLKADLGAVVLGILLAEHKRSDEMANALMGFKDLFLLGFFLSIGLSGLPGWNEVGIALLFTALLPIKLVLFFILFSRFRLRARTSFLTTLNLANYSEFGLIVGAASVAGGWLSNEWMLIFALSVSFTFLLASPLNMASAKIYSKLQPFLLRFESKDHLPEDEIIEFSKEEVVVFGMGRTGNQVYEVMERKYGKIVLGIDLNLEKVEKLLEENKNVIQGDAMDINFWQRINMSQKLPFIVLATSSHVTHMNVIKQLQQLNCSPQVAAISRFEDEMLELKESGVQVVFNLYEEAGAGFAEHAYQSFHQL